MRSSIFCVVFAAVLGCSPSSTTSVEPTPTSTSSGAEAQVAGQILAEQWHAPMEDEQPTLRYSQADLELLPQAPWDGAPLAADAAPAGLIDTWSQADNSGWCAPLSIDELEGATARPVSLDGGWSVEFDTDGAPGIRADGETCRRCGRSAFGIAGTAMPVDQLLDPETDAPPAPTYSDGSSAAVGPVEAGVASATIAVGGQSCVYQVWSFLGEAHLQQLLGHIRFVDTGASNRSAVAQTVSE